MGGVGARRILALLAPLHFVQQPRAFLLGGRTLRVGLAHIAGVRGGDGRLCSMSAADGGVPRAPAWAKQIDESLKKNNQAPSDRHLPPSSLLPSLHT